MLFVIGCVIFLSLFFYESAYIMSDALANQFNISKLTAQRTMVLEDLGAMLGAIIAGPIGDNKGPRLVFTYSLICLLIACTLYITNVSPIFMAIGMFLCGIGIIGGLNGIFVTTAKFIPKEKVNHATQITYITMFLISALVPIFTENMLKIVQFKYLIMGMMVVISGILVLVLNKVPKIKPIPITRDYFKNFVLLSKKKDFKVMLTVCIILLAHFYSFVIIVKKINLDSNAPINLGLFQFSGRIIMLLSSLIITKYLIKKDIYKVLKYTFLTIATAMLLVIFEKSLFPKSFFILILVFISNCIIGGYGQPISKTKLIKITSTLIGISQTFINLLVKGFSMVSNLIIFWIPAPYGVYALLTLFIVFIAWILANLKVIKE